MVEHAHAHPARKFRDSRSDSPHPEDAQRRSLYLTGQLWGRGYPSPASDFPIEPDNASTGGQDHPKRQFSHCVI
jgi:hypothetical protein